MLLLYYSCGTCAQTYNNCPGHFGHIDLPIPAYNPMFFDNLYAVLRAHCVHCHHFRMGDTQVRKHHYYSQKNKIKRIHKTHILLLHIFYIAKEGDRQTQATRKWIGP